MKNIINFVRMHKRGWGGGGGFLPSEEELEKFLVLIQVFAVLF